MRYLRSIQSAHHNVRHQPFRTYRTTKLLLTSNRQSFVTKPQWRRLPTASEHSKPVFSTPLRKSGTSISTFSVVKTSNSYSSNGTSKCKLFYLKASNSVPNIYFIQKRTKTKTKETTKPTKIKTTSSPQKKKELGTFHLYLCSNKQYSTK